MVLQPVFGGFRSIPKDKIVFFTILFLFVLSVKLCLSEDIIYTNKNIIQNGGFEEKEYYAWFTGKSVHLTQSAALSGGGGIDINRYGELDGHFFLQTLLVPSVLNSATLSYDLRVNESNVSEPFPLLIDTYIAKSTDIKFVYGQLPSLNAIGTIHTETFTQSADWQRFSVDIDPVLITEIQAAHAAGEFLFLVFSFSADQTVGGKSTNTYSVHMDNVSFAVNGKQQVPAMKGKIAFYGAKETPSEDNKEDEKFEGAINILDPGTGNIDNICGPNISYLILDGSLTAQKSPSSASGKSTFHLFAVISIPSNQTALNCVK